MKKRSSFKIFISLALCFSALLTLGLCSCNADATDSGTESETESETVEAAEQPQQTPTVTVADNGESYFKVVYPSDSSDTIKEDVTLLINALKKYSGGSTFFEMTQIDADESYDGTENAIILGKVDNTDARSVIDSIGYGDWTVRFSGNHLVITAYSDYALDQAISNFIAQLKKNDADDGRITLSADFSLTKTFDEIANYMPHYVCENYAATTPEGDNTSLAVISDTNLSEYNAYLGKLKGMGYTLHTTNVMENNYFATYYNDDYVIHAGFYAHDSAARITVEKKTALVGLEADNVYTPAEGVTTTLAMMGIATEANDYTDIGMGFIYQLCDGSFLVIDGAFASDAPRVYSYMRSLVPEGKLNIAAWIVTHNDGDHRECLPMFVKTYANEIDLEQVIINFPDSYQYDEAGTNNNTAPQSAVKDYGAKLIKAHTGQKFYIRDVEVEILYSIDNLLPKPLKIFNSSSLVFTVTKGSDRMLFLGDASDDAAAILNEMYSPEFLRCDFLQLAHHGKRNGYGTNMPETVKLYKSIQAEVCLWPSSWGEYLNVNGDAANQTEALFEWNCAATDIAREVYIAGGDEFTVFKLPYKPFSAVKH